MIEPLRTGGVTVARTDSLVGKIIRNLEAEPGESVLYRRAQVNHAGVIVKCTRERYAQLAMAGHEPSADWVGEWCVVEALAQGVTLNPWDEVLATNDAVATIDTNRLSWGGRDRIARHALSLVGTGYSMRRLLGFGLEWLTGLSIVDKLDSDALVCSTVPALALWVELGVRIEGLNWRKVKPDDLLDHAEKTAEWTVTWRKGQRLPA